MGKTKVEQLSSARHPMKDPTKVTLQMPRGVVEFYQDLAQSNSMTFEKVVNQELEHGAKAIIETLPSEAYLNKQTMFQRYGLG